MLSTKVVLGAVGAVAACGLSYLIGRRTKAMEFAKGLATLCCVDPTLETHLLETGRKIGVDVIKK